jgi:glycosyltransferase involved in cell wall biosynthesis
MGETDSAIVSSSARHLPGGLAVLWAKYGPYHFARLEALRQLVGADRVHALEFSNHSEDYLWERQKSVSGVITLCPGIAVEQLSFTAVFRSARSQLARLGVRVCLLPSYSPKQSLGALLAAKSLGIRTVMMNESHAGTAQAKGAATLIKRRLVRLFETALVGGRPHKRYFGSLGIPPEKIFTGYDAVDNDYFASKAEGIRNKHAQTRKQYGLPERYFLSLGRFVAKKNLPVLIRAFRRFLEATGFRNTHLVLVGSGEEEHKLKALCRGFGLPAYDKQQINGSSLAGKASVTESPNGKSQIGAEPPGVHFYGFRQIDENPVFYALADAFILPSLWEEWGLVVNEAMASRLPVVLSETAGCAEDLLEPARVNEPLFAKIRSQLQEMNLWQMVRHNGFVFNPNSSDELSRVLQFLESSSETRAAMGEESRRVVEGFSCENFARNALLAATVAIGATPFRRAEQQAAERVGAC